MRPTLQKGAAYESKAYGPVCYEGTCSTNRGGAGFCYKFRTVRGRLVYIELESLHLFLVEEEYAM